MVKLEAEVLSTPLTITRTCVAVAVALRSLQQLQAAPDLATRRNSSVRVRVRPGALPRLGGSVKVTVKFPPAGHGMTLLVQGIQMGLVGDPTVYISVHAFAGCVEWAGRLTRSFHSNVQSVHPVPPR